MTTGPRDPTRYLVSDVDDLQRRLEVLHENAAVAWDRDRVSELRDVIIVSDPVHDPKIVAVGMLGYAVDDGQRIFRLVRDASDPLGVRWIEFERHLTELARASTARKGRET